MDGWMMVERKTRQALGLPVAYRRLEIVVQIERDKERDQDLELDPAVD